MQALSTGQYVECFVKELFEDYFGDAYRESTEEEDCYFGTDCFIGDIPIDITLNADKNRTKFIKKHMLEGVTVNVLKRYGNAFHTFEKPVLVFHFELYGETNRFAICEYLIEALSKEVVAELLGLYN